MENEKSIMDIAKKECACCHQVKTLRNFRLSGLAFDGADVRGLVVNICRICEANPEHQLKSNRLAVLREKMARFKSNEAARVKKEREKEFQKEDAQLGLLVNNGRKPKS